MQAAAFGAQETHGVMRYAGKRLIACSDALGWTSIFASEQKETPYHGMFPAVADQLLVLHLTGPVSLEMRDGFTPANHVLPAGAVRVHPGGTELNFRLKEGLHSLYVYVRQQIMREVAQTMGAGSPGDIRIMPRIVGSDATLVVLLTSVRLALSNAESASGLFIDHLSRSIASHLISKYSDCELRPNRPAGSRATDRQFISAIIDYMSENLDRKITLNSLAEATGVSTSIIYRRFKEQIGQPPHTYLIGLRLERARTMLLGGSKSILDIAFDCGFSSPEHFARAYKSHFGVTPSSERGGRNTPRSAALK